MRIFISYSRANRRIVEELKNDLEKAGFEVWYDQRLSGGQEWWDEILHSIQECDVFLFAVTTSSLNSKPCELEYTYAIALNKAIIPIRLVDVDINALPLSLKQIQLVTYNIPDSRNQLLELIKALNQFTTPKKRNVPDPLPNTPEIPFSVIDRLADQIIAEPSTYENQLEILDSLKRQLNDSKNFQDAWQLLKQFYNQEKLFAKVKDEIRDLLLLEPDTSHLNKYVKLEPRTFEGHAGVIKTIAFSPDNSMLLTGSSDFRAILWDTITGRQIHTYKGHTDEVTCVDFSSDGQFVVTGSKDSTARLWSVNNAESISCFEGHTDIISSIKISPNGHWLFSGSDDKTARLYDIRTGSLIREFEHSKSVSAIAFSVDGKFVFTATQYPYNVTCWNRETGELVQTYVGHKDRINAITCSEDGEYVLTGSNDNSARLWDIKTGKLKEAFAGHTEAVGNVKFSPSQEHVITASRSTFAEYRMWVLSSGKLIVNKRNTSITIVTMAISNDGEYIAVGHYGNQTASILKPVNE